MTMAGVVPMRLGACGYGRAPSSRTRALAKSAAVASGGVYVVALSAIGAGVQHPDIERGQEAGHGETRQQAVRARARSGKLVPWIAKAGAPLLGRNLQHLGSAGAEGLARRSGSDQPLW